MNALDRLIAWFSPERGYRRGMYRDAFERNYDASRTDRRNENWVPISATAEATDAGHRDLIRTRARDLERNNDILESALLALDRNVIGSGFVPQATIKTASGEDAKDINDRIEELWRSWSEGEAGGFPCDVTDMSSFDEMQRILLRRQVVDGETFVHLVGTDDEIPMRLQILEPDMLEPGMSEYQGRKVLGGVEVSGTYAPVAYWFRPDIDKDPIRVERRNLIHLLVKRRGRQTRGVSAVAAVLQRIRDTGEWIDAELMASRIAACYAAFITTENPQSMGRTTQDAEGKRVETLEPGMVKYLRPNEKASFSTPGHPNTTADAFVRLMSRLTGAGLGLSHEVVSRDLSGVNYSSARQGHLEDRGTFRTMQKHQILHLCNPVWGVWLDACVLRGLVQIPDYWKDPRRYRKSVRWVSPGWSWIDPQKEATAATTQLSAGLTTLSEICGSQGKDWQEVLMQLAKEQEFAAALGLKLKFDAGGGVSDDDEGDSEQKPGE